MQVSFLRLWLETSYQDFLKSFENCSSYFKKTQYQNHFLLRQHAFNEPEKRGSENAYQNKHTRSKNNEIAKIMNNVKE